ncbi:DUF4105 domain-containing protein [Rheinheimera texasensis]|uniref:lipoprotein N-acyltransferase Lnb domain-containing protein n=1 Tax=Rheinheimera texasensis TaxID=306205 RepID=UPI0032B2634E
MPFVYSIKSWLIPALFVLATSFCVTANPSLTPANTTQWQLLLHSYQGQAQITDPDFLLSAGNFSPEAEMAKTLELFRQDPQLAFCRFPARITFLAEKLNLPLAEDRFERCPQLENFIKHVPFEKIELVYASEVTSSATSMLGHIFIKVSGTNSKGNAVAHSLAYFTEITTLNPAKLIVESTMTGMPGFFSVRPFAADLKQYRDIEQRNLWQFNLSADAQNKRLLQLHIWELHQVELTYYFQSFNCATLTLEMLALLKPEILQDRRPIVSPIDVVKAATNQQMVQSTIIDAASPWLFYAMADTLPSQIKAQLDEISSLNEFSAAENALTHPLAARYLDMRLEQSVSQLKMSPQQAENIRSRMRLDTDQTLDLSHYKHPARTPQDAAFSASLLQDANGSALVVDFLPAGHLLQGDNRQYLTESELQIAKISVAINDKGTALQLREFTLYSAISLAPDSAAFPVWSGEFYLGFRPGWRQDLSRWSTGELSGGFGKSYRLHKDVTVFGLAGAGMATNLADSLGFIYVKSGMLFTLAADTKLQLQYMAHSGKASEPSRFQQMSAALSWFPEQNQAFALHFNHVQILGRQSNAVGFEYSNYF